MDWNDPKKTAAHINFLPYCVGSCSSEPYTPYEELHRPCYDGEVLFGTLRGQAARFIGNSQEIILSNPSNGETVVFDRQPSNPVDRNAIKILNRTMEKFYGFITKELASALAPIMDSGKARINGIVPSGSKNQTKIPIDIFVWGKEMYKSQIISELEEKDITLMIASPNPDGSYMLKPSRAQLELDKLFENLQEEDKTSKAEPSTALSTNLFVYQKQALHWMIQREDENKLPPFFEKRDDKYFNIITKSTTTQRPKSVRGGIIADDMGLGKSLQMIALILSDYNEMDTKEEQNENKKMSCRRRVRTKRSALEKFDRLKKRKISIENSESGNGGDDFVRVTEDETYQEDVMVISDEEDTDMETTSDKEMTVLTDRETNDDESRLKNPDEVTILSGEDTTDDELSKKDHDEVTILSDEDSTGDEFVPKYHYNNSCEVIYIDSDDEADDCIITQISKDVDDKMTFTVGNEKKTDNTAVASGETIHRKESEIYQCNKREISRATLIVCPKSVLKNWSDQFKIHVDKLVNLKIHEFHGPKRNRNPIILAQQNIVLTTYSIVTSEFKRDRTLSKVTWWRIVLDEGHQIRNPNTQRAQAVYDLRAERKWALTGTPIQNSITDLWSLVKFLQIDPFTDQEWWMKAIDTPLAQDIENGIRRVRQLVRTIALRRTKDLIVEGKPILDIPKRSVTIERIQLSETERIKYDALEKKVTNLIRYFDENNILLQYYYVILGLQVKVRQMCLHSKLVSDSYLSLEMKDAPRFDDEQRRHLIKILRSAIQEECSICLDKFQQPVITRCSHVFCMECIIPYIKRMKKNAPCPWCRELLTKKDILEPRRNELEEDDMDISALKDWPSSTKTTALLKSLVKLREDSPSVKSLVVSEFTSLLDILETPLRTLGFTFVRLDGTMSMQERWRSIEEFSQQKEDSPTLMLLSLRAGGEGLNLVAASRVFLLEPSWNPAAEQQCFDRCHRLGQTKEVIITKFIVENSIEERILNLQEQKMKLMKDAFKSKKEAMEENRANRINELKCLFGLD